MSADRATRADQELLARSVKLNVGGRVGTQALGFIGSILLARMLGPAGRGLVGVMVSVSTIGYALLAFGQPLSAIYYSSRRDSDQRAITGNALLQGAVMTVILVPIVALFPGGVADLFGHRHGGEAWILVALLVPIQFLNATITNQLLGTLRFGLYNGLNLLSQVIYVVCVYVMLGPLKLGILGALLATAIGSLANTFMCLPLILRGGRPRIRAELASQMARYGFRIQIGAIFQLVNYRFDVLIMQFYRPLRQVGFYVVAQTIAELVIVVAIAFQSSVLPLVSRPGGARERSITGAAERHYGIIGAAGILANLFFGSAVILLLYGPGYRPALLPMIILLPGIWFLGMGIVVGSDLSGRGRPGLSSLLAGMAGIVTVALDFALIPRFGVYGGALASDAAYATFGVGSMIALSRVAKIRVRDLCVPRGEDLQIYARFVARLLSPRQGSPVPAGASHASAEIARVPDASRTVGRGALPAAHTDSDAAVRKEPRSAAPPRLRLLGTRFQELNRAAPPAPDGMPRRPSRLRHWLEAQRGEVVLTVGALAALLVAIPMIPRLGLTLELLAVALGAWLAWKSVAIPLALNTVPPLVAAIVGYNPLPKGGFTFLFAAWTALGVAFVVLRSEHRTALRGLLSVPVLASLALLGLMLLRLGPSPDEAWGSEKLQLYVADLLIPYCAAVVVGSSPRQTKIFFRTAFAVAFVGAVIFLAKLLGGTHQAFDGRFSVSSAEYPINLGRASSDGVFLSLYLFIASSGKWLRLLAAAAIPLLLISLVAAGSRGPVVAFVLGLIVLLALTVVDPRYRRRIAVAIGVFALAAIVVPLAVPGSAIGRALSTIVGSASGLSSNGRSTVWALALQEFSQHFAFGIGWGGFAALGTGLLYPHNILLEVACELGIVGLVVLCAFLVSAVRRMLILWRASEGLIRLQAAVAIALFVSAFFNACVSGAIQDNWEVWLWSGLALGFALRSYETSPARSRLVVPGPQLLPQP
jgi:O-antigen/teichoic acid export membrane protein/O-antigen ligase